MRFWVYSGRKLCKTKPTINKIFSFRLSLIVLYGPARYQFEHSVLREDIAERRICLAYREFTPMYLKAGIHGKKGQEVLVNAQHFWTTPLQLNKKS